MRRAKEIAVWHSVTTHRDLIIIIKLLSSFNPYIVINVVNIIILASHSSDGKRVIKPTLRNVNIIVIDCVIILVWETIVQLIRVSVAINPVVKMIEHHTSLVCKYWNRTRVILSGRCDRIAKDDQQHRLFNITTSTKVNWQVLKVDLDYEMTEITQINVRSIIFVPQQLTTGQLIYLRTIINP